MDTLLILVQGTHFAAAMLLFGALAYRFYAGDGDAAASPSRLLRGGAAVALLTGLAWLCLEAGAMGNGWGDAIDPATIAAVIADTAFGAVWGCRLILALALVLAFVRRPSLRRDVTGLILAAAFLASLALIGHAIMRSGILGLLQAANQMLHLLAAGLWLGGLPMLARDLLSKDEPHAKLMASRRFSLAGLVAVPVLLVTGTVNTLLQLGSFAGFATPYGRVLEIKLCLVGIMILIASANRLIFLPRANVPARSMAALGTIGRAALAEIVLGMVVLIVASLLGSLQPPFLG